MITRFLTYFPKNHLLLASVIAMAMLVTMVLLPSANLVAKRTAHLLAIDAHHVADTPQAILAATAVLPTARPNDQEKDWGHWRTVTIQTGDTVSALFKQQALDASVVYQVTHTPKLGNSLASIRAGQALEFRINQAGELTQLRYVRSQLDSVFFSKAKAGGYQAEVIRLTPQVRQVYRHGRIDNSLFLAGQKAGLSDGLIMQLANLFGWDIDFVQDIRAGDTFSLIYEEHYLDANKLKDGDILAATFTNQGKTYTGVRYTNSRGATNYYTPDGKSMRKAFLRTPVEFTRISARFDPHRLHPIFKTRRPHRGVDYAAPMNTPIKAAGDGKVAFAGWQQGYGKVVYLQHANNIVTLYAHQHKIRRGLRVGQRVQQGQVIGYVGQTGWATGPHLHYEFRLNGVHRNPMTVALPDAAPIVKREMARFRQHTQSRVAQLNRASSTLLASKDH